MSVMNAAQVMIDLAAAVQTELATGFKAYSLPIEGVRVGDAVVGYPEDIRVTQTFGRGMDRATYPVFVICGMPQDEATRTAISAWLGSGSIIAAIEGYAGTWSSVAVASPRIESFTPTGGSPQLALRFDVDVIS